MPPVATKPAAVKKRLTNAPRALSASTDAPRDRRQLPHKGPLLQRPFVFAVPDGTGRNETVPRSGLPRPPLAGAAGITSKRIPRSRREGAATRDGDRHRGRPLGDGRRGTSTMGSEPSAGGATRRPPASPVRPPVRRRHPRSAHVPAGLSLIHI